MRKSAEALEKKRLQGIAREYREKGYQVLLHPDETDLPSFLSGFQPDMIALGDKEKVVVEVKSKSTLSKADYLTALANAVNAQSGWRFELVVTNPVSPSVVEESAEILTQSEIQARIGSAHQLLSSNQEDAATILAWSAVEAVLRLIVKRQGIAIGRQPLLLIKELYSLGILSREDYELLQEGMRFRNLIVHGFQSTEPTSELVRELIRIVEKLLTSSEVWDGLSRRTFIGSGRLISRHGNEWRCDTWLAQLFNGCVVVRAFNVEKVPADVDRWLKQCEPFRLIGTLNDGQNLTVENIHFSHRLWRFHQGTTEIFQSFVHRPGFVEIANLDGMEESFQSITCEVTNLFLGGKVEPIEANVEQVKIRLNWLAHHNDNRQRMEALKTAGILSSITIDPLERMSEDRLDDLVRALCGLLTFAQRAPVHCVAQHWKDVNGTIVRSRYQEPVFYYPTRFRPLIPAESLATFLQGTHENYKKYWETWDLGEAINHYVQAMSLRSSWSQAVGFFTALETLKDAFLKQPGRGELGYLVSKGGFKDKEIVSQVIELLDERFEIFKDLPDEDRQALEESLKGRIGSLNMRAYKLVLRDIFRELGVPFDDYELKWLVKLRNQIIHGGSPDFSQKTPWKNLSEAYEWVARFAGLLVERTILAILDYQGDCERFDQVVSASSP
jgi:uncharacterized protein YutE (UPF0331/DUF86 family)